MFLLSESNLGKAGTLLVLEIFGAAALGVVLDQIGLNSAMALVAAWIANLFTAWYLFKAAQYQGRHALLYGLFAALLPATALLVFLRLYTHDRDTSWDAAVSQSRDEA
jgi:hypothetical protein